MHDTRIIELEAKVAELTALVERFSPPAHVEDSRQLVDASAAVSPVEEATTSAGTSRRRMLRNVALVTGGAVAATVAVGAQPAAAAHQPEDLGLGLVNATAGKTTLNGVGLPVAGNVLLVQSGDAYNTDASAYPAAVAAWSTDPAHPTGLYAYTAATGASQAVAALGVGDQSYGVRAFGVKAPLFVMPMGAAPQARTDAHQAGELIEDSAAQLWLCVGSGTPGTWRKLAGPSTAGAFHPISQVRVYDSRFPQPTPGKLAANANRVVSVKDGRDAGVVNAPDAIPAGAIAITGNVTVAETGAPAGYLTVMPGDAAAPVGSTVNWFGPNQTIANSFVSRLDANRQVKVFCGGAPAPDTHFILDVTGYYL